MFSSTGSLSSTNSLLSTGPVTPNREEDRGMTLQRLSTILDSALALIDDDDDDDDEFFGSDDENDNMFAWSPSAQQ